ncbi:hypothetical protein SAY86_018862 [Trapa natans]|uniref:DUF7725 domain-containing protein n=1 Tax=Trapa natans TaxID=22666 RepID=A0AAN7LH17_TRANT|nr:hypothetical protein SAY86_018862 [Trapa natans]
MEAPGSVAATRGSSMAMSNSRKEWRAISEHQSGRKSVDEELRRSSLGQSDERTIYEVQQGRESLDMDFASVTTNGGPDNDFLQQRLHDIVRQREELQQMEIDVRAQMITKSEITAIRNSFQVQVKEHADAFVKLQEQLHEKGQVIHDFEKKMEEKDRELLAIKRDNEAAWAKEDLLREQNKELATFRRERDHSEVERLQHIKQIHDLQEHLQDKERQLIEMQDQHRVAQETIIYKDEQLREAQAWINRVQEMDALQSNSLQNELRERTEQYNQLWLGFQRQYIEMERFHLYTIQQLQLELAETRERIGSSAGESHVPQVTSKGAPHSGQKDATQLDAYGSSGKSASLSNGNSDNSSLASNKKMDGDNSNSTIALPPLLSTPGYIPPGYVTAVHPFHMHQKGVAQSLIANVPQSQVSHYQAIQPSSTIPEWQNAQGISEGSKQSDHHKPPQRQDGQNPMSSELKCDYQIAVDGQIPQREYTDVHTNIETQDDSVNASVAGEPQVLELIGKNHQVPSKPEQILQQVSSQFSDSLSLHELLPCAASKEQGALSFIGYEADGRGLTTDQTSSVVGRSPSISSFMNETGAKNSTGSVSSEPIDLGKQTNMMAAEKTSEHSLLDERSLLACIVRTIPAGGRICINSTLPNRLGKMLSPLHWHDYKKKYGRLDDFLASHPEYFEIEGDFIRLREGAQEMISAAAAVAKVAGAAATSSPNSSVLSSVAVTPIAQSYRPKSSASAVGKDMVPSAVDDHPSASQFLSAQNQHVNGLNFSSAGGPNVKILSNSKNPPDVHSHGMQSSSNPHKANHGMTNGKHFPNSVAKSQNRAEGLLTSAFTIQVPSGGMFRIPWKQEG